MGSIGEVVTGLIEHLGELTHLVLSEPSLPSQGTVLRSRTPVRLVGQDLRTDGGAQAIVLQLPASATVRVVRLPSLAAEGLWVQPTDPRTIDLLPAECRQGAAAYGYAFDVPPGILGTQFEIVVAAR